MRTEKRHSAGIVRVVAFLAALCPLVYAGAQRADAAVPQVSVSAVDFSAAEPAFQSTGTDTGRFLVARVGSTDAALTVSCALSGTALNGIDYKSIPSSVVLPAGQASTSVMVEPTGDTMTESCETVTLTIAAGTGYSVGSPNSATVTIADSGASGPLYSLSGSDAVSSTTSTAWQSKTSTVFRPTVTDDWVVFAYVEYGNSTNTRTHVRLLQDGVTMGEAGSRPVASTDYIPFATAWKTTLTPVQHKITLDFCCDGGGAVARVRNASIVAVRKANLEVRSAPTPNMTNLTSTLTAMNTLTWTPSSPGDYLLIWSTEFIGQPGFYTRLQARLNGTVCDDILAQAAGTRDSYSFAHFSKVPCNASLQTMRVFAASEPGTTAPHIMRHCRVIAIRLTGGRFAGAVGAANTAEHTTASTTFVTQLTKTWAWNTAVNWLMLSTFDIGGSSTQYSTEARVMINDTMLSAQPMQKPVRATTYVSAGCVDTRYLGTADHVDIAFRSTSTAYNAKMKFLRFVALPLD